VRAVVKRDRPAQGPIQRDEDLVARLREGDEAAFAALVDRYHPTLGRLALGFVPSRAVAEEVVQETWLGVLDGIAGFEGRSSLKTWIFRILVNRAKTRGEREGRTIPMSALAPDDAAVSPDRFDARGMWSNPPERWAEDTPEAALLRAETRAMLEQAIAALPPSQRIVLELRDVAGLESEAVCSVLDITETNQRVLLHRARARVRAALEKELGKK
jgi:RNA polymerase sigma-70 factor (ECF subfamily)